MNTYGERVSSAIEIILSLGNGLPTAGWAIAVAVVGRRYGVAAVI